MFVTTLKCTDQKIAQIYDSRVVIYDRKCFIRLTTHNLTENSNDGLVIPVRDDLDEPLHDDVRRALAVQGVQVELIVGQDADVLVHVVFSKLGD